MQLRKHALVIYAIWAVLAIEFVEAMATREWLVAFVAFATGVLSILPSIVVKRFHVELPVSFLALITVFVFATLFLGEVSDFYGRYWRWDVVLHSGSAITFGLIGFLFALFLFEGDRYAAPPWAIGLISFTFAMTIGALWEIFEVTMDGLFGMNMQKSGLSVTMWDLIADAFGGGVGALSGFLYLRGRTAGGAGLLIRKFR